MKKRTIGKFQVISGIFFAILAIAGGFFVIHFIMLNGLETAVSGLTTEWSNISRNLNLTTTNSNIQGMLIGFLLTYGLTVRVGFGVALLLVLNALIMCTLLITTGLKNMRQK